MCSELFRIPLTWHGVPVFGFGVVLAVWLALGGWAMAATARQAGWNAALAAHLPTLLIVAALVAIGIPKFAPQGVPVRSYGLLMLTGIVAAIWLTLRRALPAGLSVDDILGVTLWMVPFGALGGRLFYVVEYWDDRIRQPTPWGTIKNALAFTEGGLVVFGAFLGVMVGFAIAVRRRKLPALALADLAAPALLVGLAFGRIGCLMNGCCYGGESHLPWAITFPQKNSPTTPSPVYGEQASEGRFYGFRVAASKEGATRVVIERVDAGTPAEQAGLRAGEAVTAINGVSITNLDAAHKALFDAILGGKKLTLTTPSGIHAIAALQAPARSLPVHPAQVYSAIDAALLAWVLWSYYPYRRHDGEVMALLLIIHPVSRFLLEAIRVDESPVWGTGLSISQNLSVAFFAIGLGMWWWLRRQPAARLAFPLPAAEATEPDLAAVR
jgi:phosphatidylglycerol:prolipoprotein diacylglycerol transferase